MRSPLCHAPLTSVASDSLNLLCWKCPAGGDWACRGLAFFVPGNRRKFAPVLCPLCRLSDLRTSRCFHSAYPSRLMHPRTRRIFDGAGERLGAKFLMRIGSTCAAIEPFGSVSLPEYRLRSLPCLWALAAKKAMARLALLLRHAALRNSRAASRCALHSMANDAKPIFTTEHLESGWHRKSTCSPGMLLPSPGVLGLVNTHLVGREGSWMVDVLEEPLGSRDSH